MIRLLARLRCLLGRQPRQHQVTAAAVMRRVIENLGKDEKGQAILDDIMLLDARNALRLREQHLIDGHTYMLLMRDACEGILRSSLLYPGRERWARDQLKQLDELIAAHGAADAARGNRVN